MNLKNKKITVVGLGKSGFSAAQFLKRQGAKARVTELSAKDSVACLADKLREDGIEVQIGGHTRDFIDGADLMVTSPGVPDSAMPLKWAQDKKIKIMDEIELACIFCKAPIIAVTGTNGKSTTTSLIGHILKQKNAKTIVCGNIGNPFSGELQRLNEDSIVVLEVSSFQLSRIDRFRPKVAVVLNVTDNHLDRHSDFGEYFDAKMRIFKNQTQSDWAIVNYEDKNLLKYTDKISAKKIFFSPDCERLQSPFLDRRGFLTPPDVAGQECPAYPSRRLLRPAFGGARNDAITNFASVDNDKIFVRIGKEKFDICDVSDLRLKGRYNLENALAAISAAFIFGVSSEEIKSSVRTFRGLEHRCEYVTTIDGIRFINDSKSTTPDATIKALSVCKGKVVLIAGGRDKNADFSVMLPHIKDKVKILILIGEAKQKIKAVLKNVVKIIESDSMDSAVAAAFKNAESTDNILLSPMCTSFDMFEDFQHRGRVFKEAVAGLRQCVKRE